MLMPEYFIFSYPTIIQSCSPHDGPALKFFLLQKLACQKVSSVHENKLLNRIPSHTNPSLQHRTLSIKICRSINRAIKCRSSIWSLTLAFHSKFLYAFSYLPSAFCCRPPILTIERHLRNMMRNTSFSRPFSHLFYFTFERLIYEINFINVLTSFFLLTILP
jgi:hypothetical protein